MWTDGEKGAILQRDRETLAIAPHVPCGVVTPDLLRKIADTAEKYDVQALKITGAARIAMVGIKEEDVDAIWNDLGTEKGAAIGLCVRSVKACPGTTFCKKGMQDSLAMGMYIDEKYHGLQLPGKLKLGVSGCPQQCADTYIKDIGLVGKKKGWELFVGGNGGVKPRFGVCIAKDLTEEQAKHFVDRAVFYFKENSKKNERMGRFIDRIGMDAFNEHMFAEQLIEENNIVA